MQTRWSDRRLSGVTKRTIASSSREMLNPHNVTNVTLSGTWQPTVDIRLDAVSAAKLATSQKNASLKMILKLTSVPTVKEPRGMAQRLSVVINQRNQAQAAFDNRPTRYRVDTLTIPPSPVYSAALNATQHSDAILSIILLDDGFSQTQFPSRGATTDTRNNGGSVEGPICPDLQTTRKRARKSSQRYVYIDTAPYTEGTAFADTIGAAKTTMIAHGRSKRRNRTPVVHSQLSNTGEDIEMTELTATPPIEDL